MSEEFATVEEAVASVMSVYPDSVLMNGLSGLYSRTRVYYDPSRYNVSMICDSRDDTVNPVVYVDYLDGMDITDSLDVVDVLDGEASRRPFSDNETDLMAAVDDVARVYIESHMARLPAKGHEEEQLEDRFHWRLERSLQYLRARTALLESVQLRFLRSVLEKETTPEGVERALDRLHVKPEKLRDFILIDQQRYERFTFPLPQ
jgi:hypothetical protein